MSPQQPPLPVDVSALHSAFASVVLIRTLGSDTSSHTGEFEVLMNSRKTFLLLFNLPELGVILLQQYL